MIILFFACRAPSPDKMTDSALLDSATENPWPRDPIFDDLAASLEQEWAQLGADRAAFAIFNTSEVVYAEGFGTELDGREINPESQFRIGSVSKMFTAIALLQELEANGMSPEDLYTTINPSFSIAATSDFSAGITFRDMMQHSTGIVDSFTLEGSTSDDALASFINTTVAEQYYQMNPPGLFHAYCNPGYALAGYAAETLSGQLYADKIEQDVLNPLNLEATTFDPAEVIANGNYATGTSEGSPLAPDSYDNGAARPAGYLWSNVLDVASFGMLFLNRSDTLLSASGMDAMLSPQISTNVLGEYSHYGYGWGVEQGFWSNDGFIPLPYMHHSGAIPGYSATVLIIPEKNIGMVALAATDGAYLSDSLFEAIALYGLPSPEPFPTAIYFDEADLDSYAGTYNDAFNIGQVIITNDDGVLRIDAPTLDAYDVPYDKTVSPYTKDHVYWNVQNYPFLMGFIRDENDKPTYFANRYFAATRVEETEEGPQRKHNTTPPIIPRPAAVPRFTLPPKAALLEIPSSPSESQDHPPH